MKTNISLSLGDILAFFSMKSNSKKNTKTSILPSKTKGNSKKDNGHKGSEISIIGAGCTIKGEIRFENDVRFEGILEGDAICDKSIILGEQSVIQGNLQGKEITMAGEAHGDVKATDILKLKKTAKINGTVVAPKMMAEFGSTLNGKCQIG